MLGRREEFPSLEGAQAASDPEGRVAAPSTNAAWQPTHWQKKSGSVGFNQWRLLHQFQQAPGLSGFVSYGCIRMYNKDILDLYERVGVGTRVVVSR
jgi:lipoprotein-anchoring transpeptidase ErfK/SrfK